MQDITINGVAGYTAIERPVYAVNADMIARQWEVTGPKGAMYLLQAVHRFNGENLELLNLLTGKRKNVSVEGV